MEQAEMIRDYVDTLAQETSSQSSAFKELMHTLSEGVSSGELSPALLDQIEELLDAELFWSKKQG